MKLTKIGINAIGVIGQRALVTAHQQGDHNQIFLINDPFFGNATLKKNPDAKRVQLLAEALRYSSMYGEWNAKVDWKSGDEGDFLIIDGHEILFTEETDPGKVNWTDGNGNGLVVMEASGVFTNGDVCKEKHIGQGGAARVLVTAPASNFDYPCLFGWNEDKLPKDAQVVTGLSCTTMSVGLALCTLNEHYPFDNVVIDTKHGPTGTDVTVDLGVSAGVCSSIAAGSTGAAKAIKFVLPDVKVTVGESFRHSGYGSISSVSFVITGSVTDDDINDLLRKASEKRPDVLGIYDTEYLEPGSGSIIGCQQSGKLWLTATSATSVAGGSATRVALRSYYDNVAAPSAKYFAIAQLMAA